MDEVKSDAGSNKSSHVVSKMEVDGFWRDHSIVIPFEDQANFLIGPNGSGKTTIVNLLAAALTGDFQDLDRVEFKEIRIFLRSQGAEQSGAFIRVSKTKDGKRPFPEITYRISGFGREDLEFSLDDIEEQMAIRDPRYFVRRRARNSPIVAGALGDLIDVAWLSVHRFQISGDRADSPRDSLVDAKLESQANLLVRYLSRLDQKASDVLRSFQQDIFLRLLTTKDHLGGIPAVSEIEQDRLRLVEILEQFKLQRSRYQSRVETHFELVRHAVESFGATPPTLEYHDFVAILNQQRVHAVVGEWAVALKEQKNIYRARDAFISILNRMLIGKELYLTPANEFACRMTSGRNIPLKAMSSGEKQLIIIMGQALLQDGAPCVFIADEPELSLHVAWQEVLVDNIRELNSAVQIIFATHSPDIVGRHQRGVIDSHKVFVA